MGFTLGNLFGSLIGLLDNSGVRQIADSPGAKALAANRVMDQARHTLPGIIADEIAHGDPDRGEQAVIEDMDGRIWHNARPDITDYYVAELRGDPAYDGPLRDLIRQALTTAAEAAAATHNAPPLTVTDGATQVGGVTQMQAAFIQGDGTDPLGRGTQIAPADAVPDAVPLPDPQGTEGVIVPPAESDAPQTFDR